jgi:hypothetical protein
LQALGQRPSNRYEKKKESGDDAVHILLQMVMVDPNGILLCENRKAAGGCWLMALIRHIEEACDVLRKLAMSASKIVLLALAISMALTAVEALFAIGVAHL